MLGDALRQAAKAPTHPWSFVPVTCTVLVTVVTGITTVTTSPPPELADAWPLPLEVELEAGTVVIDVAVWVTTPPPPLEEVVASDVVDEEVDVAAEEEAGCVELLVVVPDIEDWAEVEEAEAVDGESEDAVVD